MIVLRTAIKIFDGDAVMNLEHYRVFCAVARCGSITGAAKQLFLAQPTVSYIISNLEEEVGCQLFLRTPKGVRLTPEGDFLLRRVSGPCEQLEGAAEQLQSHLLCETGLVRVGATGSALRSVLPGSLETFRAAYPGVSLHIFNSSSPVAIQALRDGNVDIAVLTEPFEMMPSQQKERISPVHDTLIAGLGYQELKGKTLSLRELGRYPFIEMQKGTATRTFWDQVFEAHGVTLSPSVELATVNLILPMVRHNLGIGFAPRVFWEQERDVFPIPVLEPIPDRYICVVTDQNHPLSIATQKLKEILCQGER